MRLPQDIANLLAVAVRDVIWYKDSVCGFLEECGVPPPIMLEVRRRKATTPTVKLVQHCLDCLSAKGDEGFGVARKLLTRMHYWNDLQSVPPDKRDAAVSSLKALREAYKRYESQLKYQQEQQEKRMHREREERGRMSQLDHAKLRSFRDEFDMIHGMADRQERGRQFQNLMNRIFDYYCEESKGPFIRVGEEIDGLFSFDKHWYFVEVRWREGQAEARDISVLRDRAKSAFGGDTKALFISFNGFTRGCLESLKGASDERVILMDGFDLRCVLNCQISLDVLLAEKQVEVVRNQRPFVCAAEIINKRASGSGKMAGEAQD